MTIRRLSLHDPQLRDWWNAAYASGALQHDTFFQSPQWIECCCRHFVDTHPRREALLLGVEHDGRLAALAPLFIHERSFGLLRGWRSIHLIGEELAQYPDVLIETADPAEVWNAILAYLKETYPDAWLELRDVLPESAAQNLRATEERDGEDYYRLPLGGLTAAALDARSHPHMRRELQRARKRLATDTELSWEFVTAPDEEMLQELIALNRSRFGTASWFEEEANRSFFLDLCSSARDETWCSVLRLSGKTISMLMGHAHGGSLLYLLSGIDEAQKQLSPGTMNLGRTILHAAELNYRYYDFLRGDEGYKREFAPEHRRSRHLLVIPEDARSRHRLAIRSRRLLDTVKGRGSNA